MTDSGAALAQAWTDFARRPQGEIAARIWGLWSADASAFYVFVIRPDAAAIQRVAPVRAALEAAGITAVIPPSFLHITVQSVGNTGDGGLTDAIARDLAVAVADALAAIPPFTVRLTHLGPFGSGAFIAVTETATDASLTRMQRAVVDALLAADRVPVRHPERPYLPHLSVCYFDVLHPTAAVIDALSPWRDADFGPLRVNAIDLVRIAGDGSRYPPMEIVQHIPLGG